MQLTCHNKNCKRKSIEIKLSSSCTENAKNSGFGFVFDIGMGLADIYFCEKCYEIIKTNWIEIINIIQLDTFTIPIYYSKLLCNTNQISK